MRSHPLRHHFAGDCGRLAYAPAAITAHQIHVDVIVVINVGAWCQHGREFIAGSELHVVQESLLLGRAVPAVLHGDLVAVGEHEAGDVECIAESMLGNVGV